MRRQSATRPQPRPLDAARLDALALAYVARFATTAAKLEAYLARKVRERGWTEAEAMPPTARIVARMVAAGYVDDAAFARAKSGSLLRRGYGERRIGQALGAAGVDPAIRDVVRADEAAQRRAALALARRRRFGPFGEPGERALRDKQLAAMLRAGHPLDKVRELLDHASIKAAEEWAECADC